MQNSYAMLCFNSSKVTTLENKSFWLFSVAFSFKKLIISIGLSWSSSFNNYMSYYAFLLILSVFSIFSEITAMLLLDIILRLLWVPYRSSIEARETIEARILDGFLAARRLLFTYKVSVFMTNRKSMLSLIKFKLIWV